MVKQLIFFLLIVFKLQSQDFEQAITVTSEMNYTQLFAGSALTGTITITHKKQDKVDENTFMLGNNPLKVSFLNNVSMSDSSPLVVSLYSFELPPMEKGLHVLPEVSVKVGKKIYKSFSSSFEVSKNPGSSDSSAADTPIPQKSIKETPPIPKEASKLYLKAKIEGGTTLYPGQQLKFIYQYYYKGHIDLTKEVLPLLEGTGLKKIGDKETRDFSEGDLNVSEFSQKFEAVRPGNFDFGPSIIEGKAFEKTDVGDLIYAKNALKSQVEGVTIQVLPFPEVGKPSSFNGAIGSYSFKASLDHVPNGQSINLKTGEKVTLLLEMKGDKNLLSTVEAPELTLQPGFSGNFKPSDLPPISTIDGDTKRFLVDLTPLSSAIDQIPAIEFSSFDPATKKYLTIKSEPIQLTVSSQKPPLENNNSPKINTEVQANQEIQKPSPIEISGIYQVTESDLHSLFMASYWNFLWIPIFLLLLHTQKQLKNEMEQNRLNGGSEQEISSEEFLNKAFTAPPGSPDFYRNLQSAFLKLLKEKGEISSIEMDPQALEKTGMQGEVRLFMTKLDELRFSGSRQFNQAIINSAKELYAHLKEQKATKTGTNLS